VTTAQPIILAAKDRRPVAWKNGAGSAVEVAVSPPNSYGTDFDWRVSIATIETDSEFSRYPGIDRLLMPLATAGLALEVDGTTRQLRGFESFPFAGESEVRAIEVTVSSLDLNLMVRRSFGAGSLTRVDVTDGVTLRASVDEDVVVVILGQRHGYEDLDAIALTQGGRVKLVGAGRVAVARITRAASQLADGLAR
jgi:hypothetical protein